MMTLRSFKIITSLIISSLTVDGWNQWIYDTLWSNNLASAVEDEINWSNIWMNSSGAPRPRRGHSLVIMPHHGISYLVLFGGRDNDRTVSQIPRTFSTENVNGTIEFTTYDQKPVNPCNDVLGKYYTAKQRQDCSNTTDYSQVMVGIFYNDVWAYKLCESRDDNGIANETSCFEEGWTLWHPGARQGGCVIGLSGLVCSVPSERYEHGAVAFSDGLMYIYGGYSQECGDYCDDLWAFDIDFKKWKLVYPAGTLSKLYSDYTPSGLVNYTQFEVPRDNSTQEWAGPGKRWKHGMTVGEPFVTTEGIFQKMAIYGGHRLWQGFSPQNDEGNNWANLDTLPEGGYLDDFWIYTKFIDNETIPGTQFRTTYGLWQKLHSQNPVCEVSSGSQLCTPNELMWPAKRASHGIAFDTDRNLVWIFGGYNTYFPYLSTDEIGSGPGLSSLGTGGFVPFPGFPYFLNDLWYFNMTNLLWTQIVVSSNYDSPSIRAGHIFVFIGPILFLHGGYADNNYLDDTWYFNISAARWLQKEKFVHPIYPQNCSDDELYIRSNPSCIELLWPKHLERDQYYPFEILPYLDQPYYWPDPAYGRYYSLTGLKTNNVHLSYSDLPPVGAPKFPYSATGISQYAQTFQYSFNSTHNATIVASCTSVFGEPTRGMVLDGLAGRANSSIFIAQIRIQRPGWDGCRDRADGRLDLKPGLQYIKPLARAGHRAVYNPVTREVIMYGGRGYLQEEPVTLNTTWPIITKSDMWSYNMGACVNDCSQHGDCYFGFCLCYSGFYGIDCSNQTCPGSSCYYDDFTFIQSCYHACQAGYNHTDNDVYIQDISKIPCSHDLPGEVNGICDGFGHVQCAPPFIGNDCSTKDCPYNCSFNGWCSVEYPVSRCMCQPGYFGDHCQFKVCLNNCTYPNGDCNRTSGECICNMIYNPYNNSQPYHPWDGEDCSYLFAYSAGFRSINNSFQLHIYIVFITMMTLFLC